LSIIRNPHRTRFTTVSNTILQAGVSFEAIGLFFYLASKPDKWEIHPKEIEKTGGIGRDKRLRIMAELEEHGFLETRITQGPDGKLKGKEIILIEEPSMYLKTERRIARSSDNPKFVKPGHIVKTDYLVNTDEEENTEERAHTQKKRFKPPSIDEVRAYCRERGNGIDPEKFVDYNTSKGWTVGKSPMKDWQAAVRTWEKRQNGNGANGQHSGKSSSEPPWLVS